MYLTDADYRFAQATIEASNALRAFWLVYGRCRWLYAE